MYLVLIEGSLAKRYLGNTFTGEKAEIDLTRHFSVVRRDIENFRKYGFDETKDE